MTQPLNTTLQDHLVPTYARGPVQFVRGKGARLYSSDGKEYLDFLAGIAVNALGHAHERLTRELQEQLATLVHVSNLWATPLQLEVAELLARAAGLPRVFFTNSGTEAVEACLKFARRWQRSQGHPERFGFVALEGAFHGRTFGSLSLTWGKKYREPFEPLVPGASHVPPEDLAALRRALEQRPAAVVLEPIQGEGGIRELAGSYLQEVRRLCTETGTLLVHDEVQSGCGRTGRFLAADHHGVKPDLLALAKPIAGGLPMGAALVSEEVALSIHAGEHGSTFAGGPLVCRAARVFLSELFDHGLMQHAAQMGLRMKNGLLRLQRAFPCIQEVRGRGLLLGLKLDRPGKDITQAIFDRGLIINCTAESVLRIAPPLVVSEADVDRALSIIEETLPQATRKETAL
jgi:acetylornithine/N-succinyldiaminopimelate aminotransferase